MERKQYIAMQMERIELDQKRNIFFPIKEIYGIIGEDNKFRTVDGTTYTLISDPNAKKESLIYANPVVQNKLDLLFPEEDSEIERWRAYRQRNTKFFYFQNLINGDPTTIIYETEKLFELLEPSIVTRETIAPKMKQRLELTYNTLLELVNMIDLEKLSPEERIELKGKIKNLEKSMKDAEVSARVSAKCDSLPTPIAMESYSSVNVPQGKSKLNYDIKKIYKDITKTLIAQDEPAKRVIAEISRLDDMRKKNYGILLTGSSGVGKTLLMSLIAKSIDKPLLTIDSTQLTIPGYVGKNIEQYLWELYERCDGNLDKAEHAIIFFDEIDKKGFASRNDVTGQGVLDTLLKFLDGETYTASKNPQSQTESTTVNISTENMIVVCGGAFLEVYKNNDRKNNIGFTKPKKSIQTNPTIEDFIETGQMTKEFMGRLPVIIKLNDLDVEGLKRILLESTDSALKIQKEVFQSHGVKLSTKKGYITRVAEEAISHGTGARGLNKIITDSTWNAYYDVCSGNDEIEEVILTEETVDDPQNYQLIKKRNK